MQLSPYEVVSRRPFQPLIGVGDIYVDEEGKVQNFLQHLSQTLAVINDLTCIRDDSPTDSPHSFEPRDKALLKTWKTGPPESQQEEKLTGPWDILLTT